MKYFLFFFLIFGIVAGCSVSQKYLHYNETRNNLTKKDFSKILIVGTGTSGTNLFLESLSDELNKRLKEKKIETVYYHLGNNQTEANNLFKDIITNSKYDAVLHFAQLDATNNPIHISSGAGSVPVGGGSAMYSYEYRSIRFQQKFLMRLYNLTDLTHSIVDVNLDVNIDFINPKDYSKLAEHIIRSLKIE